MTTQIEHPNKNSFIPKRLNTRAPLDKLLSDRWSPRAFSTTPIEPAKIVSLFEAARWSPSSANEQPSHFIAATRDDAHVYDAIVESLMEGNRRWAQNAPLLIIGVAQSSYSKTGKPYRHSWYDLGQSIAHLTVQASSLGLAVHQMGGFDTEKARTLLAIPDGFEPVIALAVGYAELPDTLPEDLRHREEAPRTRKPLEELVFTEAWGEPSHHVDVHKLLLTNISSTN
jgi:nitroreductase